jgi:diadenosine tetraphosphate (Ap4A) HIT family hydrolase
MLTLMQEAVDLARKGENQSVICRLRSGWAVLGNSQFILGYCLLLPDPVVPSLNDLPENERAAFLLDMAAIGDALMAITDAYRINYEILGNTDPALHAHIFPRRLNEPDEYRSGPVSAYPREMRSKDCFDPVRHDTLRNSIKAFLETNGYSLGSREGRVSSGIRLTGNFANNLGAVIQEVFNEGRFD